jgi:hypothetical protein
MVEALQARLGYRIAARLSEQAESVEPDIAERLRYAREQALARARVAAGSVEVVAGPDSALLGGGWWLKLGSLLPLAALAGGLMLIQHLHTQAQIDTAASIDAELLSDDLPPSAYADPGFAEFLKTPRD